MKNKDFFTVKVNGVDRSLELKDFIGETVVTPLLASEEINVGYYKPFTQFFIEFDTKNVVDTVIAIEYFNGSSWVKIPNVVDETRNFLKSGFVHFERPDDWAEVEVDGETQYYVRLVTSVDLTPETSIIGLNILLSNDQDLVAIRSTIVDKLSTTGTWVAKHEAARKMIIQKLRNSGYKTVKINDTSPLYSDCNTIDVQDLTAFDLLVPFELREASKFYALSIIYLDELSDEEDDKWFRNGMRHEQRAEDALNLYILKIDTNDNGKEDQLENDGSTRTNLTWV